MLNRDPPVFLTIPACYTAITCLITCINDSHRGEEECPLLGSATITGAAAEKASFITAVMFGGFRRRPSDTHPHWVLGAVCSVILKEKHQSNDIRSVTHHLHEHKRRPRDRLLVIKSLLKPHDIIPPCGYRRHMI